MEETQSSATADPVADLPRARDPRPAPAVVDRAVRAVLAVPPAAFVGAGGLRHVPGIGALGDEVAAVGGEPDVGRVVVERVAVRVGLHGLAVVVDTVAVADAVGDGTADGAGGGRGRLRRPGRSRRPDGGPLESGGGPLHSDPRDAGAFEQRGDLHVGVPVRCQAPAGSRPGEPEGVVDPGRLRAGSLGAVPPQGRHGVRVDRGDARGCIDGAGDDRDVAGHGVERVAEVGLLQGEAVGDRGFAHRERRAGLQIGGEHAGRTGGLDGSGASLQVGRRDGRRVVAGWTGGGRRRRGEQAGRGRRREGERQQQPAPREELLVH